jgi:hypothetical protein
VAGGGFKARLLERWPMVAVMLSRGTMLVELASAGAAAERRTDAQLLTSARIA